MTRNILTVLKGQRDSFLPPFPSKSHHVTGDQVSRRKEPNSLSHKPIYLFLLTFLSKKLIVLQMFYFDDHN